MRLVKSKFKISNALSLVCAILLIILLSQTTSAQTDGIKVNNGDYMRYDGSASAAYRMYGSGVLININDNSSYPVRGNLTLKNGAPIEPVTDNANLIPYVLKVPTNWSVVGPLNSPFYGVVDSSSPLVTNWTKDYLTIGGDKIIYADSGRNTTTLIINYPYVSDGEHYNTTILYRWDMDFGILLEYEMNITKVDDFSYDGFIKMTLGETSLWKLETDGIPGYPLEFFSVTFIGAIVIITAIQKRKNKTSHLEGNC